MQLVLFVIQTKLILSAFSAPKLAQVSLMAGCYHWDVECEFMGNGAVLPEMRLPIISGAGYYWQQSFRIGCFFPSSSTET
jgi:hypothetical protein